MQLNSRRTFVAPRQWFSLAFLVVLLAGLRSQCHGADSVSETALARGVILKQFHYDQLYDSPQRFFVVEADLNDRGVSLKIPYLTSGKTAPVSSLAECVPGAVAAVNAQFYDKEGSIQFLKIDGTIINPTRSAHVHDQQAVAVDAHGAIKILLRPKEGWVSLEDVPTILASGSGLIANGTRIKFDPADAVYSQRHPRTCVAFTEDNRLLIVVIDGRSATAAGQTGTEMQTTLMSLGKIVHAFNLDGGGSSTLWVKGEVLNQPSGKKERPVANALVVLAKSEQVRD